MRGWLNVSNLTRQDRNQTFIKNSTGKRTTPVQKIHLFWKLILFQDRGDAYIYIYHSLFHRALNWVWKHIYTQLHTGVVCEFVIRHKGEKSLFFYQRNSSTFCILSCCVSKFIAPEESPRNNSIYFRQENQAVIKSYSTHNLYMHPKTLTQPKCGLFRMMYGKGLRGTSFEKKTKRHKSLFASWYQLLFSSPGFMSTFMERKRQFRKCWFWFVNRIQTLNGLKQRII